MVRALCLLASFAASAALAAAPAATPPPPQGGAEAATAAAAAPPPAAAADAPVTWDEAALEARLTTMPFEIAFAKKARDLKEDTALRTDAKFADGVDMRIKIRRANPGGTEFNNEPRYERASYVLQQLLVDRSESLVPVTVLRPLPIAMLRQWTPEANSTFRGSTDVLAVVQHWLPNVVAPEDVWDPARFEVDAKYARQVANANILTYLIRHKDSNKGNLLMSADQSRPRVWIIDSGVAFSSPRSDRGTLWKDIRVPRLPADTVARLRGLDLGKLTAALGVVAQFELRDGKLVAVPPTPVFHKHDGVRRSRNVIQLGLDAGELADVELRRKELLAKVDSGQIKTFESSPAQ